MRRTANTLDDGTVRLRPVAQTGDPALLLFHVEHAGAVVGEVSLRLLDDLVGQLTWSIEPSHRRRGLATRAVRLLTQHALTDHQMARVQAYVDPRDHASLRIAGRSGLRREGVLRGLRSYSGLDRNHGGRRNHGDRNHGGRNHRDDVVVFARLSHDPEPHEPEGFRALLNAGLPRKRVIAQLAIRDRLDRLLLCQLSYKPDWDLPGGVVEVGESPRLAVAREVREELSLSVPGGGLLVVDWLPPWSGWDDACTLVFDGGVHPAELTDGIVPEPREIRTAEFCDAEQIRQRCADFTARRALAALAATPGRPRYLESGREPDW
ncbi:MAG: NUDIX hydrolase [Nocardioidaceae bacterium]